MGSGRSAAGAAVVAGLAGVLLAGCTLPAGVDGDLTSEWATMPEAVGFVPESGVCHANSYQESGPLTEYEPVGCDQTHQTETVHVGEFTGEAAERVTPPAPGSSAWLDAYQQCEEGAAGYLGADFRHGDLWLGVTVPSERAWEGGARWVRCDVTELEGGERTGSLAGALEGSSDLVLGCFVAEVDESSDQVRRLDPVPCSDPHDAEFAGVVHSSDSSYPSSDSAFNQIHEDCREQVAEFADVPVDGDLQFRTGTIVVPAERSDWENGDRGIRCYMWLNRDVTESMAGAGTSGLPVQ